MKVPELLGLLARRGVKLSVEGDRLGVRAPKGALSEELARELSRHKAEVLEVLRGASSTRAAGPVATGATGSTGVIGRRDPAAAVPLSEVQEELWLAERLTAGPAARQITAGFRIEGPLRRDALEQGLSALARRHEILRTTIGTREGGPVQVVGEPAPVRMRSEDVAHLDAGEREARTRAILAEEAARGFDLEHGPLWRATLIHRGPADHLLYLAAHHLVLDVTSVALFARELASLYEAAARGGEPALDGPPIQYGDFAAWRRDAGTADPRAERALEWWRSHLRRAPSWLDLPTDHPRAEHRSFRTARRDRRLSRATLAALKELARAEGATPFVALQAVLGILLARYTGRRDLLVGSPVSGRDLPETEALIGSFAYPLVLRIELAGNPSFRELLARVRRSTLAAFEHGHVPFARVLEATQPERRPGTSPLFQVMFTYPPAQRPVEAADLVLRPIDELLEATIEYDLFLSVVEGDAEPDVAFTYPVDLFEAETIDRMLRHYETLLRSVVAAPDARLSALAMLDAAERRACVGGAAGGSAATDDGECLPAAFERWVRGEPAAAALSAGGTTLTYGELDVLANRWAHCLREAGVGPETRVGLLLRERLDEAVLILAILKAGGAFAVLDPAEPPVRLERQLEQGGLSFVVVDAGAAPRRAISAASVRVIDLETERSRLDGELASPASVARPGDTACLVFAGSVHCGLTHAHVLRRLSWLQAELGLSPSAGLLGASSEPGAEVREVLWPLAAGARAVLAPRDEDPATLRDLVADQRPDVLHLSTGELRALVDGIDERGASGLSRLRHAICGGAPWRLEDAEALRARLECRLTCLIAPPEVGAELLVQSLGPGDPATCSLGARAAVLPFCILDDDLAPVPAGVPGNVLAGGEDLPRSSTSREDVPNPVEEIAGTRLRATGLRGRPTPEGTVVSPSVAPGHAWLGGRRAVLAEVEVVLRAAPGVADAAVLALEGRLVAYVVPEGRFAPEELAGHVAELLPPSQVPSAFVPITNVPLTAGGETDGAALSGLAVVDTGVVAELEARLRARPGVRDAAIGVRELVHRRSHRHLGRLLFGWKRPWTSGAAVRVKGGAKGTNRAPASDPAGVRPAISDGGPLAIPAGAPRTLTEALLRTATDHADKGVVYVGRDGTRTRRTYPALLEEARRILAGLQAAGLGPRDRVILQVPELADHFAAFWGCVLGGIVPVTVAVPPSYAERSGIVDKLRNTRELLEHPVVLTAERLVPALADLALDDLRVLAVESLRACSGEPVIHPSEPEDLVFFQLTSGSTGVPKCIQETHRGIVAHVHGSRQFNGYGADDVCLNWLPVDHVVPILTVHLKDVYLGCEEVQVDTSWVLTDPTRWLDLIEECRVTHTWAPNFGFKLVSDALREGPRRTWDLSSMKFFMNAGEQVTVPVVHDFLAALAPFGVEPRAMQPSFGMAEACTCMTYSNDFDLASGHHRVLKTSLGGRLEETADEDEAAVSFVDLGPPVPGVQIRITDAANRVVPEGVIGRFQIKGDVITPGYLRNDEANREAFVGDGWFNSGDLGFILDGSLSLTGREKETIIIRGVNHFCYEIEDVVNGVEGVEPTFSAACATVDDASGTEGLALFFVPRDDTPVERARLVRTVKKSVAERLGISASAVVPLARHEFPKTTSGKIQRGRLKQSLEAGRFEPELDEIDLRLENENTLPGWFARRVWRPRKLAPSAGPGVRSVLVLMDEDGLGERLCAALESSGHACARVERAEEMRRVGPLRLGIDPQVPEQYDEMLALLAQEGFHPEQIVDLRAWRLRPAGSPADGAELELGVHGRVLDLLFLAQALGRRPVESRATELVVVGSAAQPLEPGEEIDVTGGALPGLVRSIPRELPWLACRHVDLPPGELEGAVPQLVAELDAGDREAEVAHRGGRRLVCRLEEVDLAASPKRPLPFVSGGTYLLSGGLGGVGAEIASYLLRQHDCRLLVVGRTPLSRPNDEEDGRSSERLGALRALQLLGEVRYATADVADPASLRAAVLGGLRDWGGRLDGVLHLAGILHERTLAEETSETFTEALRAKLAGSFALHRIAEETGAGLLLHFSSVNGLFGGFGVGAYSAANAFLERFAHDRRLRSPSPRVHCFAWSSWDDVGMSRGGPSRELLRRRGFHALSRRQGLHSLLAALAGDQPELLIGLDVSRPDVGRFLDGKPHRTSSLVGYVEHDAAEGALDERAIELLDAHGTRVDWALERVSSIPRLADGGADHELLAMHAAGHHEERRRIPPRNELESRIAGLWCEALGIPEVGVDENFFDLGGHSMLLMRIHGKLVEATGRDFPLLDLLRFPTVATLAAHLVQDASEPAATERGRARAEQRRSSARRGSARVRRKAGGGTA